AGPSRPGKADEMRLRSRHHHDARPSRPGPVSSDPTQGRAKILPPSKPGRIWTKRSRETRPAAPAGSESSHLAHLLRGAAPISARACVAPATAPGLLDARSRSEARSTMCLFRTRWAVRLERGRMKPARTDDLAIALDAAHLGPWVPLPGGKAMRRSVSS